MTEPAVICFAKITSRHIQRLPTTKRRPTAAHTTRWVESDVVGSPNSNDTYLHNPLRGLVLLGRQTVRDSFRVRRAINSVIRSAGLTISRHKQLRNAVCAWKRTTGASSRIAEARNDAGFSKQKCAVWEALGTGQKAKADKV